MTDRKKEILFILALLALSISIAIILLAHEVSGFEQVLNEL